MLRMNLFYRKPRSFATTQRHSFSATDGCPPSRSAFAVGGLPFKNCISWITHFQKATSAIAWSFAFPLLFVRCPRVFLHKVATFPACWVFSCTRSPHSRRAERFLAQGRRIPVVPCVFLHFRTFCSRFHRTRLPDPILHLTRPSARLRFASDSPANRYGTPFRKNDFPSDSEAFPTRIFKSLLSHFEFTVYRHFFEKENSNGKSRCFERTLYCKIIIVARSRNDAEIVRAKPQKHTTCHSYSKHSLLRARRSYPLVRPPFLPQAVYFLLFSVLFLRFSVLFLRFSVLFLRFLCFLCVPMCFSVSAPSFFISRPTSDLNLGGVGASERRSFNGFSLFRSGVFQVPPRRDAAFTKIRLWPCSRNFGGNNFPPGRIQNRHSKAKPFCNIIIVYMPRGKSFVVSIFYEFWRFSQRFSRRFLRYKQKNVLWK